MKKTESAQEKNWIDFLNRQIDIELQKPENEQSMEFIDECNSLLDEARGEADAPDAKIKERKLAELYAAFEKQTAEKHRSKVSRLWKRIAVAACAVLAITITPVFVAAAVNQISPIAVLEKWGHEIFNLPYDTPTEEAGMTFIRNGDVTHYESLDKLIEAEKLDILYPAWLPDGVVLTGMVEVSNTKGKSLIFMFSSGEIFYSVFLYDEYSKLINEHFTDDIIEINDVYYYLSVDDGRNNAISVNNGYSYSVTADNRYLLIKLLEGIA